MTTATKKKPKKKAKAKCCDCISIINKELESMGENTRVTAQIMMDFGSKQCYSVVGIACHKADSSKRGKTKSITPTYCPFCGKKYPE